MYVCVLISYAVSLSTVAGLIEVKLLQVSGSESGLAKPSDLYPCCIQYSSSLPRISGVKWIPNIEFVYVRMSKCMCS